MENRDNMNQTLSAATLCSGGCGFFGTPQFDNMCSVCYKESVKRKQQNTAAASMGNNTNVSDGGARVPSPSSSTLGASAAAFSVETAKPTVSSSIDNLDSKLTMESENIAVTTVSSSQTINKTETLVAKSEPVVADSAAAVDKASIPDSPAPSEPATKTKKRTRCFTCKKKVGLTGKIRDSSLSVSVSHNNKTLDIIYCSLM